MPKYPPNELLKTARILKNWSQQDLAEKLTPRREQDSKKQKGEPKRLRSDTDRIEVVDETTVSRWERGVSKPFPHYQNQLVELFGRTPKQLGFTMRGEEDQIPFWDVAERKRNPKFTGREDILSQLATIPQERDQYNESRGKDDPPLQQKPQVLSGLGGCGKSQIIFEYAYRYKHDYHTIILLNADKPTTLQTQFAKIAHTLGLPELSAEDENETIEAVKKWFEQPTLTRWLLIFDNVDTDEQLQVVRELLPSEFYGHVILTTRTPATGTLMQRIELESMQPEEGATFLLRRADKIADEASLNDASEDERQDSKAISTILGGLPLALDQAGAYILETPTSLQEYKEIYETTRKELLAYRGDNWKEYDYPDSVATTWLLNFRQVGSVARELLSFFAFLAPDAIQREIIINSISLLVGSVLLRAAGDRNQLNLAIGNLRKYSLITNDSDTTVFTIHRLVQAVVQDEMDKHTRREWAVRTVRAVDLIFPETTREVAQWEQCERFLPHALVCDKHIEANNFEFDAAFDLLDRAADYLVRGKGQYPQAELLYQHALAICERQVKPNYFNMTNCLTSLGRLYGTQGKYEQAEPLLRRALAIRERKLGPEHHDTAASLNNLTLIYIGQGKYEQAELLLKRALEVHASAYIMLNLGLLYTVQGKYEQAEPLYQLALELNEKHLEPDDLDIAFTLNNLARFYGRQGKYEQAEPLFRRALEIAESKLGSEHHTTANFLLNLALLLYEALGKYEQAEPLLRRALVIYEQRLPDHPNTKAARMSYNALIENMKSKYNPRSGKD